jgi:hypothetical protein
MVAVPGVCEYLEIKETVHLVPCEFFDRRLPSIVTTLPVFPQWLLQQHLSHSHRHSEVSKGHTIAQWEVPAVIQRET